MMTSIMDAAGRALKSALRQMIGPAIGACVVGYFVYYGIYGDRGFLALQRLRIEIARADTSLQEVQDERKRMEHRAMLLRGEGLDGDMLDERARTMLNLTHPQDLIVTLPKPLGEGAAPAGSERRD